MGQGVRVPTSTRLALTYFDGLRLQGLPMNQLRGDNMSAGVVFIRQRTHTPSELKIYSQKAPASLAGKPVTIHALYGRHEVIEGAPIEGAAILEFPSFGEAKEWYDSPSIARHASIVSEARTTLASS